MDTKYFKKKLEEELKIVEGELTTLGRKSKTGDWEATGGAIDTASTQPDELADRMEEYEERRGVLDELEVRYNEIKKALQKIEEGTYGICEISGGPIEEERLMANPAARTCKKHMNREQSLS